MARLLIKGQTFAAALLGGMLLLGSAACSPAQDSDVATPGGDDTLVVEPDSDGDQAVIAMALTAEGREFFLDGQGEGNPDLVVQQGDRVEVTLCVTGGTHDWVIAEFGAATERISVGDECSTVEFVADQAGEFEYYCGVGNHRAEGMAGRFVVE